MGATCKFFLNLRTKLYNPRGLNLNCGTIGESMKTEFKISYDATGDLNQHQINAKDLGNAIVGMYDLITKAAEIVSNGSSSADLKVVAPAKEGSLEVIFAIIADPLTALTVLKTIGIGAASAATGVGTAIGIMDRIRDKKIDRVVVDHATQKAVLETKDGKIETDSKVALLVSNKEIRQALNKVIQAPVQGRPDAKVSFTVDNESITLEEDRIQSFTQIRSDVTESETTRTYQKTVRFTKLSFKSKRGWYIQSTDGMEASVSIKDATFLQKIASNQEAFKKETLYTVEIAETTTVNVSGSKVRYAIVRVINEAKN